VHGANLGAVLRDDLAVRRVSLNATSTPALPQSGVRHEVIPLRPLSFSGFWEKLNLPQSKKNKHFYYLVFSI
jgi:hypothetical protein